MMSEYSETEFVIFGCPRDVMHYNALMKVHIQNGHAFSPTEMMAEIQEKGLSPNRVTFQRLIERYCQAGDVEGAKTILAHMKAQNVPINELVFNSLIGGHMRAGDEESARGILKIMKDAGISPSGDSYSQLLHAYARQGNMDAISQTLNEAREAKVHLHPNHYIDLILSLCEAGHGQYTQQIMDKCPRTLGFNQDCMNGVIQLVARGETDHALTVYLNMNHPPVPENVVEITHARFMMKAMIKHGVELDRLCEILCELGERRLSSDGAPFIAKWALVYGRSELAYQALQLMSQEGHSVRTHYFWPLYVAMTRRGDVEGMYGSVAASEKLVTESNDFISTLHEYVIPGLLKMGQTEEQIETRLKDLGILAGDTRFALVIHHLKHGRVDRAVTLCKEGNVRINQSVLSPQLRSLVSQPNVGTLQHIIDMLATSVTFTSARFHPAEINGHVMYDVITKRRLTEEETADLVQTFVDKNLGVAPGQVDGLRTLLEQRKVPADLIGELFSIETARDELAVSARVDAGTERMTDRSIEELEAMAAQDNKTAKKWLLYKLCIEGDVKRAEEIRSNLEGQGFIFTPDLLRQLWYLEAVHKRDIQEALRYKEKMETDYADYGLYANNVLHTCVLLAEKRDTQGVLDMLDDYHRRHHEYMSQRQYSDEYKLENSCCLLLKACQEGCGLESGKQVMEKLFDLGYVKRGTYSLLKQYVSGYVDKQDITGLMEALQFVSEGYDRSPEYNQIFKLLIEREDSENLQKVMDMVSVSFGEMQALHHLVSALIQCGQVDKARNLIETPGIRALNDVLDKTCNYFIQTGKTSELESLVEITKGMFGLDRESMLFLLIKGYSREGNVDKALETLTSFEEENVNPRPRTLRYLSKVLQTHGRDVPFDVPDIVTKSQEDSLYSDAERMALEKAASGVVPGMAELKQRLGGSFSPEFLKDLTRVVYSARRPGSLKFLVYELASMGDVESLDVIRDCNLNALNKGLLHAGKFRGYIESNRPDDCISLMEKEPDQLSKYLNTKTINLFKQTYPHMYDRFEELCLRHCDTGDMVVAGFLWNSAVMLDDFNKADQIVKRFPQLMDTLRIATVCVDAKHKDDEEKLNYIIKACSGNSVSSGFAYSYLIGLYTARGDATSALDVVERAQNSGLTLDQLRPQALAALEDQLVRNQQQPPWQPGQFSSEPSRIKGRAVAKDQQQQSSSSSSSDSGSDSESSSDDEVKQRT